MKTTWTKTLRRLAAAAVVGGSTMFSSALSYAVTLAYDDADDPVYADGWQGITNDVDGNPLTVGDNGGTGFTAWNFDSGYVGPGNIHYGNYADLTIKDIHPGGGFNNIGKSWRQASSPTSGTNRAGRGFSPLQIGQTLEVLFDNPTRRQFFKGYFIRLNGGTGGVDGNLCALGEQACTTGGTSVRKMYLSRFEYFNYGEWSIVDQGTPDFIATGVVDTDTAAAGALFSVTRTGADTYDVLLDPLGTGPSFMASRTFANAGVPVDWIEFTFFNPVTDASMATDMYIRSMRITGAAAALDGDYNDDNKVDAADYVVWRKNPGAFGGTPGGYNTWRENFGEGGAGFGGAIPEPTTLVLVAAFGVGLGLVLPRSRRESCEAYQEKRIP